MFGSILSGITKIATCPIDVAEAVVDVALNDGDGSKQSRRAGDVSLLSDVRDGMCNALEDLDD